MRAPFRRHADRRARGGIPKINASSLVVAASLYSRNTFRRELYMSGGMPRERRHFLSLMAHVTGDSPVSIHTLLLETRTLRCGIAPSYFLDLIESRVDLILIGYGRRRERRRSQYNLSILQHVFNSSSGLCLRPLALATWLKHVIYNKQ